MYLRQHGKRATVHGSACGNDVELLIIYHATYETIDLQKLVQMVYGDPVCGCDMLPDAAVDVIEKTWER